MQTIGMLGGMSWKSTGEYYRLMNEDVSGRLGGLHSAQVLLHSVDFAPIEALQREAAWHEAGAHLADAARNLEAGGAHCVVLCTNTMHIVAEQISSAVTIPFLHIADVTGIEARSRSFSKVGFIGTGFSMREQFLHTRLAERHGISTIVPDAVEQAAVHDIIYRELCVGKVTEQSRAIYRSVLHGLARRGAQAIVLGCTEIMLLVKDDDSPVPLLDTTALHARAAVDFSLAEA
jgi:aspartate racemase